MKDRKKRRAIEIERYRIDSDTVHAERIERFIEDLAFLRSYDSAPRPRGAGRESLVLYKSFNHLWTYMDETEFRAYSWEGNRAEPERLLYNELYNAFPHNACKYNAYTKIKSRTLAGTESAPPPPPKEYLHNSFYLPHREKKG